MKIYNFIFSTLGIVAAVAIALGAYWHIFTLGACALMVYAAKSEQKSK